MNRIFGASNQNNDGDEQWMSVSDLMAGLMMVFLFVSISLMREAMVERDEIKEVAKTYQTNQQDIYHAIIDEFEKDLDKWKADIDRETLSFNFKSPDVLFANGRADLTLEFKNILEDFFPRYLNVMEEFKGSIQEIRIEGHTSSRWNKDTSPEEAYFNNMRLSQSRTRSVLQYGIGLADIPENQYDWVKKNVAALGYSSSKLIYQEDGIIEDEDKSRRVSFRVLTNAEMQIRKIIGE